PKTPQTREAYSLDRKPLFWLIHTYDAAKPSRFDLRCTWIRTLTCRQALKKYRSHCVLETPAGKLGTLQSSIVLALQQGYHYAPAQWLRVEQYLHVWILDSTTVHEQSLSQAFASR